MHIKKYWLSYTLYHPTFTIASKNGEPAVISGFQHLNEQHIFPIRTLWFKDFVCLNNGLLISST